jgi:hypothetical protein
MTREQRICSDGKSVNYVWAVDARKTPKKRLKQEHEIKKVMGFLSPFK